MNQGKFYNSQYDDQIYGNIGLPDLKIVDLKVPKNKKLLTIGGGMGADVWFLTKENEVHLIDSSEIAVKIAIKHGIKAKVKDVETKLPYLDKTFDIVILKDILEHMINPLALLLEAKRVLKNGGYIIVSVPNHFFGWFRLRILFGKNLIWKTLQHDHTKDQNEWDYMHVRFFTWQGFKKLIDKADFKIEKGYWDFGTLAHYSDPEMFYEAVKDKPDMTAQAKLFINLIYPVYCVINLVFPKTLRAKIVELNPGLLCAGFYLRLIKN